jgi:phosphohistidine phosphatase
MKRLYLVRHAKSSWDDPSLSDFDRPLNDRGNKDAPMIGEKLKEMDVRVDKIISSPANRAKTTAKILSDSLNADVEFVESIYESSDFNLLSLIRGLDEGLNSVMVVGHNPSMTSVINKIGDFTLLNLPTCGVVGLEIDGGWSKIEPYSAKKFLYIYPKMFKHN